MNTDENKFYFDIIDEIGDRVYEIYHIHNREDIVMVYEMQEEKIYVYGYGEFFEDLNKRSQAMLAIQHREAREQNKIVLFIRDNVRKKFKSFTV